MELGDSDKAVRDMHAPVLTGRTWRAEEEVKRAVSRLHHQEVVAPDRAGRLRMG